MNGRTRVKICGITRLEDAMQAARLGADAIGFVFVPASRRAITVEAASRIASALPAFVTSVGLFLDADADDVSAAIDAIPALVPQFHGRESAADCERFGRRYLKAFGLGGADGVVGEQGMPDAGTIASYRRSAGFLFDSHAPGQLGGTGVSFDWRSLRPDAARDWPLILAGGLDAGNVGAAIEATGAWAVDVSSGVESTTGIKDHGAMRGFIEAVRTADARRATSGNRDN